MLTRVVVPLVILLAGRAVCAAEAVELRYAFEKGGTVLLHEVMETSVGFQVPQRGDTEARVRVDRTWEETVASVRGRGVVSASLRAKIRRLAFHMAIPDKGSVQFDSEAPTARQEAALDPIAAGLYRLRGRPFQYKADGAGRAVRVTGLGRAVQALFGRVKAKEAVTQGAAKICQAVFGDEGFQDALEEYYLPLPPKEVLPRDRWKGKMANAIYPIGVVHASVEYVLEKVEDGVAHLSMTGKAEKVDTRTAGLELPAKDDPTMGMLSQILSTLVIQESSVTGSAELDLSTGRMRKTTNTVTLRCRCELALWGNPMEIPFDVKKTRTMEAEKEKEEEK